MADETEGDPPKTSPKAPAQLVLSESDDPLTPDVLQQLQAQFDRLRLSPRDQAALTATVQTVVHQAERTYSGPLPPADDYAAYGSTLSTAPERIMAMAERRVAMAEKQQGHDHRIEGWTLASETIYRLIGLIAGALLVGGMIAASAYCASIGAWAAAAALGAGGAITGVGGIFVRGRDIAGMKNGSPTPTKSADPPRPPNRSGRQANRNRGRN